MRPETLALTNPDPRVTRRLVIGLAVSMLIHLMVVLGISPKSARFAPPLPLEVEIRRIAMPESVVELPAETFSEFTAKPADTGPAPVVASKKEPPPAPAAPHAPLEFELPLDEYFTAREVDVRPEQINEVDLVYPRRAYEIRTKGRIVLRIFINEHGAIDNVAILESTPPGVFEEAALTATLALQFKPAIKNGRNVKSQKTIEVVFDPYESINIP